MRQRGFVNVLIPAYRGGGSALIRRNGPMEYSRSGRQNAPASLVFLTIWNKNRKYKLIPDQQITNYKDSNPRKKERKKNKRPTGVDTPSVIAIFANPSPQSLGSYKSVVTGSCHSTGCPIIASILVVSSVQDPENTVAIVSITWWSMEDERHTSGTN